MATALITGAGKRIGKEIAVFLAKNGYNIALHYNSSVKDAEILSDEIRKIGVKCYKFKCDLSDEKETLSLIKNVYEEFNDLEILINSASVFKRSKITELEPELINEIFNINFKAPLILSKYFALTAKKGNIINILDTLIQKNNSGFSIYTLSKKALKELTLMSAKEFAPNIRVNGIAPGLFLPKDDESEEYFKKTISNIPLKRIGSVDDLTETISFILKNDYLTGQIIYLDGGQNL